MPKARTTKQPATPVRAKVDDALWEKILLFYVNNPKQHMQATKVFGLSRRTLTGLFYEGAQHLNKPPMKNLVGTVEVRARALRAGLRDQELARADQEIDAIINATSASALAQSVDDAARARSEEGAVVGAARRNILSLQSLLIPLLAGAKKRARDLEKLLDNDQIEPWELLKLFRELGKFQHDLNSAAKINMDMERMLMGEPAESKTAQPMTQRDAVRVLELGARTLERMRGNGRLIEGKGIEVARVVASADDEEELDPEDLEPEPFPDAGEESERFVQPEDLAAAVRTHYDPDEEIFNTEDEP